MSRFSRLFGWSASPDSIADGIEVDFILISEEVSQDVLDVCQKLVDDNPQAVEDFKGGNQRAIGPLIGQARRQLPNVNANDIQAGFAEVLKIGIEIKKRREEQEDPSRQDKISQFMDNPVESPTMECVEKLAKKNNLTYEEVIINALVGDPTAKLKEDGEKKIQWLGGGSYFRWILSMCCVSRNAINMPEDKNRVKAALSKYERLKELPRAVDSGLHKDINKYETFGDLEAKVEELDPVKSKRAAKREAGGAIRVTGQENDEYYVINLPNERIASDYARGSRWCTSGPLTAAGYITHHNGLFQVWKKSLDGLEELAPNWGTPENRNDVFCPQTWPTEAPVKILQFTGDYNQVKNLQDYDLPLDRRPAGIVDVMKPRDNADGRLHAGYSRVTLQRSPHEDLIIRDGGIAHYPYIREVPNGLEKIIKTGLPYDIANFIHRGAYDDQGNDRRGESYGLFVTRLRGMAEEYVRRSSDARAIELAYRLHYDLDLVMAQGLTLVAHIAKNPVVIEQLAKHAAAGSRNVAKPDRLLQDKPEIKELIKTNKNVLADILIVDGTIIDSKPDSVYVAALDSLPQREKLPRIIARTSTSLRHSARENEDEVLDLYLDKLDQTSDSLSAKKMYAELKAIKSHEDLSLNRLRQVIYRNLSYALQLKEKLPAVLEKEILKDYNKSRRYYIEVKTARNTITIPYGLMMYTLYGSEKITEQDRDYLSKYRRNMLALIEDEKKVNEDVRYRLSRIAYQTLNKRLEDATVYKTRDAETDRLLTEVVTDDKIEGLFHTSMKVDKYGGWNTIFRYLENKSDPEDGSLETTRELVSALIKKIKPCNEQESARRRQTKCAIKEPCVKCKGISKEIKSKLQAALDLVTKANSTISDWNTAAYEVAKLNSYSPSLYSLLQSRGEQSLFRAVFSAADAAYKSGYRASDKSATPWAKDIKVEREVTKTGDEGGLKTIKETIHLPEIIEAIRNSVIWMTAPVAGDLKKKEKGLNPDQGKEDCDKCNGTGFEEENCKMCQGSGVRLSINSCKCYPGEEVVAPGHLRDKYELAKMAQKLGLLRDGQMLS